MTIDEIKRLVANSLRVSHPEAKVIFREGDYGPNDILVFAYNVNDESVAEVENRILNFDWEMGCANGVSLTPHVKSATITSRYYPQHKLPSSTESSEIAAISLSPSVGGNWQNVELVFAGGSVPANEELALAA